MLTSILMRYFLHSRPCLCVRRINMLQYGAGGHVAAVRLQINKLCTQLAADAGKLALLMCEGFGIPDHLLQAPIAFNWQQIGTTWKHV